MSGLDIGLGQDKIGREIFADLTAFPHLLVAGMTGTGKSTWLHDMLIDLIEHTPDEVRLVLIDPKRVELARYRGLEHLVCDPITDPDEADVWLAWLVEQMEQRFELLAATQRRSVDGLDIPRIVLVVDELAHLILGCPQAERRLVKLATLGRAAGVHLVLATQRPSADVMTGLLRANIPGRVVFGVMSRVDSQIALGFPGAEKLSRGELLALFPGGRSALQLQGRRLSDAAIAAAIRSATRRGSRP